MLGTPAGGAAASASVARSGGYYADGADGEGGGGGGDGDGDETEPLPGDEHYPWLERCLQRGYQRLVRLWCARARVCVCVFRGGGC
jgi:hypothetical protein